MPPLQAEVAAPLRKAEAAVPSAGETAQRCCKGGWATTPFGRMAQSPQSPKAAARIVVEGVTGGFACRIADGIRRCT